jgi:signal transduction histidine kinase
VPWEAHLLQALTSTDGLSDLLPKLHEHAVCAVEGRSSILFQFSSGEDTLRPTSTFGVDRLPPDAGVERRFTDQLFREGVPVFVPDTSNAVLETHKLLGARSAVFVPLACIQVKVGVLLIDCPHPPSRAQLAAAAAAGHAFALALERERLTGGFQMKSAELRNRPVQSEKLVALGQFVAGIAHELNNPLQAVLGNLELMRATGAFPKAIRRDMQRVYREADRAAKIVRNLLVFAGSRRLKKRRTSVNALLSRVLALRARAHRDAGIEIVRNHSDNLPRVKGDPLLLHQALLNIILNAEDAIGSGGGRIESQSMVDHRHVPPDVVIQVRDSGPGIPAHVMTRLFEPFYTTKEVGKGTGLGLAITYGIIQDHGGHVVASNHPDGGALFTVRLPMEQE